MKKCCIIGGTGLIGSSLLECIFMRKRKVTVVGRSKECEYCKRIEYLSGNCLDITFLNKYMHSYDELIILSDFVDEYKKSKDFFIKKIFRFFYFLSQTKIKKIILLSSGGAIYGNSNILPITEEFNKKPISDYGKEKLLIEEIGLYYFDNYNLPIIFARPSNVYGKKQIPFTGQGFIATALASIKEKKIIEVYGSEGTIRDYIHVDDIALGIFSLLDKGKIGEAYNIGTTIGLNNFEILEIMKKISSCDKILVQIKNQRVIDVNQNVLDCSKIKSHTGWSPKIKIEEGIGKILNEIMHI